MCFARRADRLVVQQPLFEQNHEASRDTLRRNDSAWSKGAGSVVLASARSGRMGPLFRRCFLKNTPTRISTKWI